MSATKQTTQTKVLSVREPKTESTTKADQTNFNANVTTKVERLYIRASRMEKIKLERAAEVSHTSRSQFVLQQALDAAERVLSEQTRFVLSKDAWNAFCERLDAPERDLPNIRALADEPSPFNGR